MQKNAPDFIGIGADHAGLGIIAKLLAAHPGVVSEIPAARFFNQAAAPTEETLARYEATLPPREKKHRLRGECSAEYLTAPAAAERIVTAYPTAKLFVVVRHPIHRALAVYEQAKRTGHIKQGSTCAEYLLSHPITQTDGFYGHHLSSYFSYYTSLQLYTIVYEDFVADPLKVIQGLYAFLDVDANFIPQALAVYAPPPDEPVNPGRIKRLFMGIGRTIKKWRTKPSVPITPALHTLTQFFSPEELSVFKAAYVPDAAQLTNILHRDMGVFWDLLPANDESAS